MDFREAALGDLSQIVQMLADDELGKFRERYETLLPDSYVKAFKRSHRKEEKVSEVS